MVLSQYQHLYTFCPYRAQPILSCETGTVVLPHNFCTTCVPGGFGRVATVTNPNAPLCATPSNAVSSPLWQPPPSLWLAPSQRWCGNSPHGHAEGLHISAPPQGARTSSTTRAQVPVEHMGDELGTHRYEHPSDGGVYSVGDRPRCWKWHVHREQRVPLAH